MPPVHKCEFSFDGLVDAPQTQTTHNRSGMRSGVKSFHFQSAMRLGVVVSEGIGGRRALLRYSACSLMLLGARTTQPADNAVLPFINSLSISLFSFFFFKSLKRFSWVLFASCVSHFVLQVFKAPLVWHPVALDICSWSMASAVEFEIIYASSLHHTQRVPYSTLAGMFVQLYLFSYDICCLFF